MKKVLLTASLYLLTFIPVLSQIWIESEWNPFYERAELFLSKNNFDSAMVYAQKALSVTKQNDASESKYAAFSHALIGEVYYRTGEYEKAVEKFTLHKDLIKSSQGSESRNYASALNNLSAVLQTLGRYSEALPLLEEALDIKARTVGELDSSYAYSLNNLGELYQSIGSYEKAEKYYNRAVELKEKTIGMDNASYGKSLLNLAILYMELNIYEKAIPYFKESADILKRHLGETNSETMKAYLYLAESYIHTGKTESAKPYLEKAEKLQQSSEMQSDPKYAETLYYFGIVQWSSGSYAKAESLFLKAKLILERRYGNAHPMVSDCINNLGVLNRIQGRNEKALEYLSQAVYIREVLFGKNHLRYINSLHNLAGILNQMGDYKQAKEKYFEAFDLYLKLIDQFIPFLSENEKAAFYFSFRDRFDLMNNFVLMHRDRDKELLAKMYDLTIATKAFLLKTNKKIRESIYQTGDESLITKYEIWLDKKSELAKLYSYRSAEAASLKKRIDSLAKESSILEKEISKQSAEFLSSLESKNPTWRDVQAALGKNEAAVEIVRIEYFDMKWTDTVFYAALIVKPDTKEAPELVLLDNGWSLEHGFLNNYHKRIKFKIDDKYTYRNFWAPIEENLQGIERIFISPDGVYNKINLNTLKKTDESYVIDHHEIVIVTNTADLADKNDGIRPVKKEAALIGYPKYKIPADGEQANSEEDMEIPAPERSRLAGFFGMRNGISELPETEIEINSIKSILEKNTWQVKAYEQMEASEKIIKNLNSPEILHIATHGYFLESETDSLRMAVCCTDAVKSRENPLLRSGLLFAGAENFLKESELDYDSYENGLLTALETKNLKLNGTSLVVLSACETGLGVIKNGEGVYGLQRAFQSAGADAVIMSLWKVDDKTTRELMTSLYTEWTKGKNLSAAFKYAQEHVKKKYSHPYYWGAFILIGSGSLR